MEEELSLILRFLDLEDPKKQAEFLTAHRGEVTDKFLTSAAVSLDYPEKGKDLETRCSDLIHYLNTRVKDEKKRVF